MRIHKININITIKHRFSIFIHISKIHLLLFSIFILFSQCNETEPLRQDAISENDTCFYKSSSIWKMKGKYEDPDGFLLVQDKKSPIYSGSDLYLIFNRDLKIKTIKLHRLAKAFKNQLVEYKLYLNHKYAGKYKENQILNISRKINAINFVVVKTCTQQIIPAWDDTYYYSLVIDTSALGIRDLQISFTLDSADQSIFLKQVNDTKSKSLDIEPILLANEKIPQKPFMIVKKERNGYMDYEQIINLNNSGRFQILLIKKNRKYKSIETDLHYQGTFNVFLTEKYQIGFSLNGFISGINKGKSYTKEMDYKLNPEPEKISYSDNKLPFEILLDLPDDAMVNINFFDKSVIVDIPYATENNMIGEKLYPCNKCFLRYVLVKAIIKAMKVFNQKGLNIKLLDCYRPLDVQKLLYNKFPFKGYVADPIGGSIHNRGTAVDLTFADMNGKELDMGSDYDEFSAHSHYSYKNLSDTIIKRRKFLHETMIKYNFLPIRMEWWHFEFIDARKYKIINDSIPCSDNW
jgi:D-alanyl-D-alanine dipeptidase